MKEDNWKSFMKGDREEMNNRQFEASYVPQRTVYIYIESYYNQPSTLKIIATVQLNEQKTIALVTV